MKDYVDAVVYLQIAADQNLSGEVTGARVLKATQRRSRRPAPGSVEVAMTVRIPRVVFEPLRPDAVVTIDSDLIAQAPLVITPISALADEADEEQSA